jgi:glycosyltransferase involved in cell wall biosynthesis
MIFTIFLSKIETYHILYNIYNDSEKSSKSRYEKSNKLNNRIKILFKHNGDSPVEILNTNASYGEFQYVFPVGKNKIIVESNSNYNVKCLSKKKHILNITNFNETIKINDKKSILLIIDSYGWAFDNISKNVKRYSHNYNITIITYPYLHEIIKNDTVSTKFTQMNHILFFWYAGPNLEMLDYFYNNKKKYNIKTINLCIYDYSKWVNTTVETDAVFREGITYFFQKIDNYLYGCNFIKKHIEDVFKDKIIEKKINGYQIFDGVNINMFPYFGYSNHILSKNKIIVGWIGNSNPKVHGINKGYEIIKNCVDSMSNEFIFLPLDIYTSNTVIKHKNVHCYLSLIDIIVCYSTYEGTPNQILEASSCGKCWISTNVGIVEELQNTIDGKQCGIIINRTTEELTNALLTYHNNRNMMIDHGNNGRKAIEKKWSWEKNVQQFYDFFDKICN